MKKLSGVDLAWRRVGNASNGIKATSGSIEQTLFEGGKHTMGPSFFFWLTAVGRVGGTTMDNFFSWKGRTLFGGEESTFNTFSARLPDDLQISDTPSVTSTDL